MRQTFATPPTRPCAGSLPVGRLPTRLGTPRIVLALISVPSSMARVTALVSVESKAALVFLIIMVNPRLGVTMNVVRRLTRLLFPA